MKTLLKTGLVLGIALALPLAGAGGAARAGTGLPGEPLPGFPRMVVVVNEFCEGMFSRDGMNYVPLPCQIEIDPLSGIPVPCFFLPVPVIAGDVVAIEPDGIPSDLLRFPNLDGSGVTDRMYFYSDRDDQEPNPPPSDVGLPDFFQPNLATVQEVGDEGLNYFTHATARAIYFAISDFDFQP